MHRTLRKIPVILAIAVLALSSVGWVYPEHRDITLIAIRNLDAERRALLDQLWAHARRGHETRFTQSVADPEQGRAPLQIDFAAWPAIAADHSCSPADMLTSITTSEWILDVAGVAAEFKHRLSEATRNDQRDNAMRDADLLLQRADPEYATRSAGSPVHYPIGRQSVSMTPTQYFDTCFAAGADMNAYGAYGWYHYSALLKARRYRTETLSAGERTVLAQSILADEAYAAHFLQDVFAAGHAAVTRGSSATRKGTHDYFNEFGYETKLWNGPSVVLVGDVYMRTEDAELAAVALQRSLEQVLDAVKGISPVNGFETTMNVGSGPDTLNTCTEWWVPKRQYDAGYWNLLSEVLAVTPIPGLGEGLGELPRFQAELGPFIGIMAATRGSAFDHGFGPGQNQTGAQGSIEFMVQFGVGLEGIMNKSSDGQAFIAAGNRLDGPSSSNVLGDASLKQYGALFSAIPTRQPYELRVRLPFWLVPGDLLVAAPVLLVVAPEMLPQMAVGATNGGLIPWQARLFTSFGSFQFVLGREIGISMYGYGANDDKFLYADEQDGLVKFLGVRSVQFTFPLLEYRPFREFAMGQSSRLKLQIFAGVDVPMRVRVVDPASASVPTLRNVWHGGIRLAFDWRHYF